MALWKATVFGLAKDLVNVNDVVIYPGHHLYILANVFKTASRDKNIVFSHEGINCDRELADFLEENLKPLSCIIKGSGEVVEETLSDGLKILVIRYFGKGIYYHKADHKEAAGITIRAFPEAIVIPGI